MKLTIPTNLTTQIETIGRHYLYAPEWRPSPTLLQRFYMETLNQFLHMKLNIQSIEFEPGQHYADLRELVYSIEHLHRLRISTDFNNCWYLPSQQNLERRAVHDYTHYLWMAGFDVVGELRVASHELYRTTDTDIQQILFSDTVGQLCGLAITGEYPEQRLVRWPRAIIQDVMEYL